MPHYPEKGDDHQELHNLHSLMVEMLRNTCAGHIYDEAQPDKPVYNGLVNGKEPLQGREVYVYKYNCHCVEYEVHVVHAKYDNETNKYLGDPEIIKVLEYGI